MKIRVCSILLTLIACCDALSTGTLIAAVRARRPVAAVHQAKADRIRVLFRKAESLIRAQKCNEAIAVATRAIKLAPDSPWGYQLRTEAALIILGDVPRNHTASVSSLSGRVDTTPLSGEHAKLLSKAVVDLNKAIQLGNSDTATRTTLAQVLMMQSDFRAAIRILDGVIKDQPKDIISLLRRAYCRLALNDIKGSLHDSETALTLDSNNIGAIHLRSIAKFSSNEFHAVINDMTRSIRLNANSAVAYETRGAAYLRLGKFDEALKDTLVAVKLAPRSRQTLINLGIIYIQKKEPGKAIPHLNLAMQDAQTWPQKFSVLQGRAKAYLEMRNFDKAIADADSIISLSDNAYQKSVGYLCRSIIYQTMRKTDAANRDKNTATWLKALYSIELEIQQSPRDPRPYISLAEHHLRIHQNRKAKSFYDKAVSLRPDYAKARKGRAALCLLLKSYNDVIADCNVVLKSKPNSAEIYLLRAKAYLAKKKYDAAIADFTKGRGFGADFAAAYIGRAKKNKAAGRTKEAEDDLQRARFLDPTLKIE